MWEDLLEALAVGGSGAISGYMQTQEANAARAERERERQAMEAYREATMAMDRERLEMARAAADEAERKDIEERMGSGQLRVAREIPNLAAARSTIAEALKAGEGPEDMFEGAGLGMAAKPAAGQTYAAQMQREKEQERTDVGRTPMSFLDEIPEFEPSETFREAGSREFEGQALRPTTPAERAATERERKDLERREFSELLSRALAGDEEAITEVYLSDLGRAFESIQSLREPDVEVPDIIQTAAGFGRFDPETGTIVPVRGSEPGYGGPPARPSPSGPSPRFETAEDGTLLRIDPYTGMATPVINEETGEPVKMPLRSGGSPWDQLVFPLPGGDPGAGMYPGMGGIPGTYTDEEAIRIWEAISNQAGRSTYSHSPGY